MRHITINVGDDGPKVSVHETDSTDTWELEWSGHLNEQYARRILKAAETVVLRNGGERLVLTCRPDDEVMRAQLDRWRPSTVSRAANRYAIELIVPAEDGFIHDDDDFRTPLQRITCPTCVERIAQSRTKRRQDAFGKNKGAKAIAEHSRRVAEAYCRLAEIEEAMEDRRSTTAD